MICPKCRHEIYSYPCVNCNYDVHSGKVTRKSASSSKGESRTLKEIGAMWKAKTDDYRKAHKWMDFVKQNRQK